MELGGILTIILTLALIGFVVYLIVTYIPMEPIFKQVILVVVAVLVIVWVISIINGGGLSLPPLGHRG